MSHTRDKTADPETTDDPVLPYVFPWIETEEPHTAISPIKLVEEHGVPHEVVMEYLKNEVRKRGACYDLLASFVLIVLFYVIIQRHDPILDIREIEDAAANGIATQADFMKVTDNFGLRSFSNVESVDDFWTWMTLGYVPLVFQQQRKFSEGIDLADPLVATAAAVPFNRGRFLSLNLVVGGVRMRQERSNGKFYDMLPDFPIAQRTSNPKREEWLWVTDDFSKIEDLLLKLKVNQTWLDSRTEKVEVTLPLYNAENGVHSLILTNFYFSRGGLIFKKLIPMSTLSYLPNEVGDYLVDAFWALCALFKFGRQIKFNYIVFMTEGRDGLCKSSSIGLFVDILTSLASFAILIIFYYHGSHSRELESMLIATAKVDKVSQQAEYRERVKSYIRELEIATQFRVVLRLCVGCYPVLSTFQFFNSLAAIPRLGFVTKALQSCFVDVLHFFVVFASVFGTFAIAGVALFGRDVDGFATIFRALISCFRLMFGDFDWTEMMKVGSVWAATWWLSFVIVIVFVMLNMLLSMVMGAHSEQHRKVKASLPLKTEFYEVWRSIKEETRGKRVALSDVMRGIGRKTSDSSSILDDCKLQDLFPTMKSDQAFEILKRSAVLFHRHNVEEGTVSALVTSLRKVNRSSRRLKCSLKDSLLEELSVSDAAGCVYEDCNDEVSACRADLKQAREWISTEDAQGVYACASGATVVALPESTATDGPARSPLDSLADAPVWSVKQVLQDEEAVLRSCMDEGKDPIADRMRRSAVGRIARVLRVNNHLNEVLCRVPGVGDVWLGISALAHVQPPSAQKSQEPEPRRDLEISTQASSSQSGRVKDAAICRGIAKDEYQRRLQELEEELRAGKHTVSEALTAVSELEWRLLLERDEKDKIVNKLQLLKTKVTALKRENERLLEEGRRQDVRLSKMSSSREEYHELVQSLTSENKQLESAVLSVARRAPLQDARRFPEADALVVARRGNDRQQTEDLAQPAQGAPHDSLMRRNDHLLGCSSRTGRRDNVARRDKAAESRELQHIEGQMHSLHQGIKQASRSPPR